MRAAGDSVRCPRPSTRSPSEQLSLPTRQLRVGHPLQRHKGKSDGRGRRVWHPGDHRVLPREHGVARHRVLRQRHYLAVCTGVLGRPRQRLTEHRWRWGARTGFRRHPQPVCQHPGRAVDGGRHLGCRVLGDVAGSRATTLHRDGGVPSVLDALGSTIAMADDSANTLSRHYAYDPDGNATTTGSGATTNLLFAGGHQTGSLYHYGARYYDPATATWTQQDPINQIASLTQANHYTYAGGDPIDQTDVSGLRADPTGALCAVGRAVRSAPGGPFTRHRLRRRTSSTPKGISGAALGTTSAMERTRSSSSSDAPVASLSAPSEIRGRRATQVTP
jgi:RHS repeat-associated protein